MEEIYENIPTYDYNTKIWSTTSFTTRREFADFIFSIFKEPGLYDFDESSEIFNSQASYFNKHGYYTEAPFLTKDFVNYWDDQKLKCRKGILVKNNGSSWFIPRDYYMWLNYLPIFDKEEKKFGFAKIRDAQYHMALYELLAELNYKHVVILKKRQIASSYYHMSKLLNMYWFEEGSILKLGASLKDYINEKGSWKFLDEYRNFLNQHTAWYRPNEPDKVLSWQQKIKVRIGGRDTYKGLKSVFSGMSFEKDPTNGVGGPVTYFFHEEAGIAPKMDDTYGYMRPAMRSGMMTTGMFIAAGSVGDLSQCEPLRRYVLNPTDNDFYAVDTTLIDNKGTPGKTGLFIPEQWSMYPYIDRFGNSVVFEPKPSQVPDLRANWTAVGNDPDLFDPTCGALKALDREFAEYKKKLDPSAFQLEISQRPRSIEEAFATRNTPIFPTHLIAAQMKRIEDKTYPVEYLDLEYDEQNKVQGKSSRKLPIMEFPLSKKTENKEGVLCCYERPIKNAEWGTYYASIDPVGEGKTTTSESLCSIIVYKNPIEVTRDDGNGNITNHIERDKIVATWCGRFDDLKKTHELLEKIIEWYNAWTIVEVNVALFIQYMISKRKQKYLVPKDQLLFIKDLTNAHSYQEYGWKNTGTFFKTTLLSYGVQSVSEEIDQELREDGEIIRVIHGVERIPDPMILKEMQDYTAGLNVDRIVAYCALVAFAEVQRNNRGLRRRVEVSNDKLDSTSKMSKLIVSPFRHMGRHQASVSSAPKRSAYRNLK